MSKELTPDGARMVDALYEPNLNTPPMRPGHKLTLVSHHSVASKLIDDLTGGNNGNRTATEVAHTANGVVLESMKRTLRLLKDLGYVVAVPEPLASAEEVEAAGLDSTGRDGDPRFPYSKGDLARHSHG